jgi:hypothetical protein
VRDINFAMCHSRPIPIAIKGQGPYTNKNRLLLSPIKITESSPQTTPNSNQGFKLKRIHKHKSLIVTNRRHIHATINNGSEMMPHDEIEMLLRDNPAPNFVKSNSIEFYDNVNMNVSDDYYYYFPYTQGSQNYGSSNKRLHHTSDPLITHSIERF